MNFSNKCVGWKEQFCLPATDSRKAPWPLLAKLYVSVFSLRAHSSFRSFSPTVLDAAGFFCVFVCVCLLYGGGVLLSTCLCVSLGCLFCVSLVSWGRLLLLWISLWALLILNPIGFGLLCFHYHLFLCIFFYFLFISSVISWLFISTLFILHIFVFLIFFPVQFSSVAQSCLTICNPMNHSTPGLPVHHRFLEFTQTHVHRVGNAIKPSHPLSSASPPAPNPSQHQGLYQWVNSSHEVAKVLQFQLQHQSFQWTPKTDLL